MTRTPIDSRPAPFVQVPDLTDAEWGRLRELAVEFVTAHSVGHPIDLAREDLARDVRLTWLGFLMAKERAKVPIPASRRREVGSRQKAPAGLAARSRQTLRKLETALGRGNTALERGDTPFQGDIQYVARMLKVMAPQTWSAIMKAIDWLDLYEQLIPEQVRRGKEDALKQILERGDDTPATTYRAMQLGSDQPEDLLQVVEGKRVFERPATWEALMVAVGAVLTNPPNWMVRVGRPKKISERWLLRQFSLAIRRAGVSEDRQFALLTKLWELLTSERPDLQLPHDWRRLVPDAATGGFPVR